MKAAHDAAVARMKAVWRPTQVHEPNKVPASPVTPYAVVAASAPGSDNRRNDGTNGSSFYRIAVQAFGKTMGELVQPVEAADVAFKEFALTLPGYDTTPAEPEIEAQNPYRDPDGGTLLTLTLTYTFHAYPA